MPIYSFMFTGQLTLNNHEFCFFIHPSMPLPYYSIKTHKHEHEHS